MGKLTLFARPVIGFFRAFLSGSKARRLLEGLAEADVSRYVNRILSEAVLLNEVPSPTDNEERRRDFVMRRLQGFGISNLMVDDAGNLAALFPAFGTRRDFLLLAAELGDPEYSPLANSVRLSEDRAVGQGLGERSLGAAALLVLAEFAQEKGFYLDKNLLLLFTPSSAIDETGQGFQRFLDAWAPRISCGIVIHGTGLGRVESRRLGLYRLALELRTAERDLLSPGGAASAAGVLGCVAAELVRAAGLQKEAVVNLARLEAGVGYGHWPTRGSLEIEILSEKAGALEAAKTRVREVIETTAADFKDVSVDLIQRSHHPVSDPAISLTTTEIQRSVLTELGIRPETGLVCEKVALLQDRGVPALRLGVTTGRKTLDEDFVDLGPLETGFRQALLLAHRCSTTFTARRTR